jgi:hypothetical protein
MKSNYFCPQFGLLKMCFKKIKEKMTGSKEIITLYHFFFVPNYKNYVILIRIHKEKYTKSMQGMIRAVEITTARLV